MVPETTISRLLLAAVAASLALLAVWAYTGYREEHGWHHGHTHGGQAVIADMTVNLNGIPRQEHCQTCHPDGAPAATTTPAAGQRHPDIRPHSIYDLGCTACHLGEGMAADMRISHGRIGDEVRKVLSGGDLQASCYGCHPLKPLKGAENAWQGYLLFSETACDTCHTAGGVTGASYGPDLSEAGSFLALARIRAVIKDPKADLESSIMPKFSLAPEEIESLSYFLKSRVKDPYYETPMVRTWRMREELTGARPAGKTLTGIRLLKEKRCLACHKYGESDGQIAPDLSFMAWMRPRQYVMNFLRRPAAEIPGAIMPVVPMSAPEEGEIVRFLHTKGAMHLHGGTTPLNIYMMVCDRCHAAKGDGLGTIQPNLSGFPRPFLNNAPFFTSIPDARIMESIEKGIPGTSMPPFGNLFGRETINPLVDHLFRAFIRAGRLDKKILVPPPAPAVLPASDNVKAEYDHTCFRCHGREGHGKGPEYLKYLPRPRNLANRPYFGSLSDDRIAHTIFYGVPSTAMQPFQGRLSSGMVWGLVRMVRTLSGTGGADGRTD